METFVLYLLGFFIAWELTHSSLSVLYRTIAKRFMDTPGGLKKHARAVPVLGGCGILAGVLGSLLIIRLCTNFPSGTLHNLRGILLGSMLIFAMGLWDDLHKPNGVAMPVKLFIQALAACALIYYDVTIHAVETPWLSYPLTFLWIVGLTNAFNLLDIMDGLCVSQAIICTLGLIFITLPSEFIYVNFAAVAVLGACLAFWPYNHDKQRTIFLGDSGSNLLGFLVAALSIGSGYCEHTNWGFLAPLLILALPLFDTAFVCTARLLSGKNPLKGSDDHAALRLRRHGWSNRRILTVFMAAGLCCNSAAWLLTRCNIPVAVLLLVLTACIALASSAFLLRLRERV